MKFLHHLGLFLYSLAIAAILLYLLWLLQPVIVNHPKISSLVLLLALPTAIGAFLRSSIEMTLLIPIIKMSQKWDTPPATSYYIFFLALLAGLVIPWIHGIKGFGFWEWAASILFTLFIFETFFAFTSAILSIKRPTH